MNAYELALQLQVESSQAEYGYVVDDWKLLDDSAKMLRQQADRIAELSKNVDELEEELLKTPQIKELSDEEILSLSAFKNSSYDVFIEYEKEDLIKFARAILKKASDK